MAAAVAAVAVVAEVPATATAAAIPAVEAVAAIPATGAELEADRVAEALAVAAKAKEVPPVVPLDAIIPTPAAKPEGVPDKFWDATTGEVNYVEWNKAHTALETKFHEPTKTPELLAAEKIVADAATAAGEPKTQDAAIALATTEYADKGALTPETYKTLEASGITRATVDKYIADAAAQTGQAEKLTSAAHEASEGADNYAAMLVWAEAESSNAEGVIKPQDVNTFNALVASGDAGVVKDAVAGLYTKYRENVTIEGERIGGTGATSGGNTFASKAEMTAAMNLPSPTIPGKTRYEIDPAYRIECQNKIKASRKAGIAIFS